MLTVKCPNCGRCVVIPEDFLGRQVGCINCNHVYILSEQYHDFRYRQLVIVNSVVLILIIVGIVFKIESDYNFIGRNLKAATKALENKLDKKEGKESSSGIEFFDFDRAYGTVKDKLKRTMPIVLPGHKGRIVKWSGEVLEVNAINDHPYGNYYVKFRQAHGSSSDVTVYFRDDQAEALANIQKGHYLKYKGSIVSAAYGNANHILRGGKILE